MIDSFALILLRIKLLVLGQENVGKTTTVMNITRRWKPKENFSPLLPAAYPSASTGQAGNKFVKTLGRTFPYDINVLGATTSSTKKEKKTEKTEYVIPSTDGIEISNFTFPLGGTGAPDSEEPALIQQNVPMVTVSVWDFGGK